MRCRLASVGENTHGDHGGGGGRRQLGAVAADDPLTVQSAVQVVDEKDEQNQERNIVTFEPMVL